jgi:hypothetical protein
VTALHPRDTLRDVTPFDHDHARRKRVSAFLGLADDPDYAVDARPLGSPRVSTPYFSDWDLDLPTGTGRYFDEHDASPSL